MEYWVETQSGWIKFVFEAHFLYFLFYLGAKWIHRTYFYRVKNSVTLVTSSGLIYVMNLGWVISASYQWKMECLRNLFGNKYLMTHTLLLTACQSESLVATGPLCVRVSITYQPMFHPQIEFPTTKGPCYI